MKLVSFLIIYIAVFIMITGCGDSGPSDSKDLNFAHFLYQDYDLYEGSTLDLDFKISFPSDKDLTFEFEATAIDISAEEFTLSHDSKITVPAGKKSVPFKITYKRDYIYSTKPRKLILTLKLPAGFTSPPGPTVINFKNLDLEPVLGFETRKDVLETDADFEQNIDLTLDKVSGEDAVFNLAVKALGDASGPDIFVPPGPHIIPAGETSLSIPLTIIGDTFDEDTEEYELYISDYKDINFYTSPPVTVIISDNDPPPQVSYSLSKHSIQEGDTDEKIEVTVKLDRISERNPTVAITPTENSDIPASGLHIEPPTLSFESGETEKTAFLHIIDNNNLELDKTAELQIACQDSDKCIADTAIETFSVIEDEENPTVGFDFYPDGKLSIRESSDDEQFKIYLAFFSNNTRKFPVKIPFNIDMGSADNEDFTVLTQSPLTVQSDEYGAYIELNILSDPADGDPEQMTITLLQENQHDSANISANNTLTVTLLDYEQGVDSTNPYLPIASFVNPDQEVDEDAGTVSASVSLDAKESLWGIAYKVTGSAKLGKNYSDLTDDTLVFPLGVNTQTLSFNTVHNNLYDHGYTVILTLEPNDLVGIGSPPAHTVRIKNIDPKPVIQFSEISQEITEGDNSSNKNLNVRVSLTPASGIDTKFRLTLSGTAELAADFNGIDSATEYFIQAGQTFTDLNFNIVGDNGNEQDETLVLTLTDIPDATMGTKTVHTINIADNDSTYTLNWDRNIERTVNSEAGGGYRIYYSKTPDFDINGTSYYEVLNPGDGSLTPTSATIDLPTSTYYFKVVAFSQYNTVGSEPSSEVSNK